MRTDATGARQRHMQIMTTMRVQYSGPSNKFHTSWLMHFNKIGMKKVCSRFLCKNTSSISDWCMDGCFLTVLGVWTQTAPCECIGSPNLWACSLTVSPQLPWKPLKQTGYVSKAPVDVGYTANPGRFAIGWRWHFFRVAVLTNPQISTNKCKYMYKMTALIAL